MPGTRGWIILGLWLTALALVAQAADTPAPPAAPAPTSHAHHKSHKTTLKPLALPPLPSGPLSQLPMDQLPAVPAQVSYQGGLLSIAAQNSTLSEILGDVRKLTGATIDIPPGSGANERVVVSLGPGEPRDVLARLLNGSSFNYVMVGSNSDPKAVASLILMVKPATSGEPQPAPPVVAAQYETTPEPPSPFRNGFRPPERLHAFPPRSPGAQQANAQPPNANNNASNDDKDDDDDSSDDSDDSAQAQPGQPTQPQINNPNSDQSSDQNQPNAGPKTPEQIMQMLQRAQQPGAAQPINPNQPPPQQ